MNLTMYETCMFAIIMMKEKKMKFNIMNILLIYDCLMFIANSMFNFLKFI